jgi:hypothetical protein
MGRKLPHKKAFDQYTLIHELRKKKGYQFKCDVKFDIPDEENIYLDSVNIALTEYPYATDPYYTIGIFWEDKQDDLNKDQVELLNKVYSRLSSTNYQIIKQELFDLVIENDDVTLTLSVI